MTRRRMKEADRREAILEAAITAFAEKGSGRTRISDLAEAAGVAPSLLYRHFPSKVALERAVHARMIAGQNDSYAAYGTFPPTTAGVFEMLARYFAMCALKLPTGNAVRGGRLMMLSLAGDGDFIRTVLARASKLSGPYLKSVMAEAEAAGELNPHRLVSPENAHWFLYSVGQTITNARLPKKPAIPYSGSDLELVADAVAFCARGLGFSDKTIREHYRPDPLLLQAPPPRKAALQRSGKKAG